MAILSHHVPLSTPSRLAPASLLAWCALAVALFAAMAFWFDLTRFVTSLGNTEDAPIAALRSRFELILPQARAELAVRTVWPLLVLLAFVYLMAREAEVRGGRAAGLLTIALTVTCLVGIVWFLPGRIDHHNVLILCAVIGILRLARSFDDESTGWSAGVFLGLGTAIGFEGMALTMSSLGLAVLYGVLPHRSLLGPSRAAVTFAATLTIALAMTTASERLFISMCDALSINIVVLAVCAAIGVTVVQVLEECLPAPAKLAGLALAGAGGVALYALAEPECLARPFGQVDRASFPVWPGSLPETQGMLSLGEKPPFLIGMALIYLAVGLYCGLRLMQRDRSDDLRFHVLMVLISLSLSFWQIELLPYATFLSIPLLAIYLARSLRPARQT